MYALIAPGNVDTHWDNIAPWLEQAIGIANPMEDLDIIKDKIRRGVAQLWLGKEPETDLVDMVLITEGMVLDGIPTLVIRWLTSTGLEQILEDFDLLENWAKNQGFTRIQVWGRRGWERRLRTLGFVHNATILDKFITQGLH
jgi:hypothetical protein